MSEDQLSKLNPDGTNMGQSITDKIAFYGVTNVVQGTGAADGTDAATTQTLANAMKLVLDNLGLQTTV
ncbi:MAG TPA: hypothetical protein ENH84_00310 [Phycisphaerae bacterium]|nr:hypothetical protein [Phycisphaerae bacterium]